MDVPTDILASLAGVLAAGAGVLGLRKAQAKGFKLRRRYNRKEAEAIVTQMELLAHHKWPPERREREIDHVMKRHRR